VSHTNPFFLFACVVLSIVASSNATAFTPPQYVNPSSTGEYRLESEPRLATSGNGVWIAVWGSRDLSYGSTGLDKDIAFSRSTDHGATWSAVAYLNSNATSDSGHDMGPDIATDGSGNWVVVWTSTEDLNNNGNYQENIFYSRSVNNGVSWSAPALLNPNAPSNWISEESARVETDGNGRWIVLWSFRESFPTNINPDEDIYIARSDNNGGWWTTPAPISGNLVWDADSDYDPHLATDGSGNWVAAWNRGYDTMTSRSTNNGATWSSPVLVDAVNAPVEIEYVTDVTTDGAGNWLVVRRIHDANLSAIGNDGDLSCSRSTNNGVSWSAPVLINSTATSDSGFDGNASIITNGSGNWIALWTSTENIGGLAGTDSDVLVATSTDVGTTWSAAAVLTSLASSDTGSDGPPSVVTDENGLWAAVWSSTENLGGVAGTDSDIFVSQSTNDGMTWSGPDVLAPPIFADIDRDFEPSLATDDNGTWVAVWPIGRESQGTPALQYDVAWARSTDNGMTWSAPDFLSPSAPTPAANWNCRVATDKQGTWVVVWESTDDLGGTIGTDRDILFSRSTDNGIAWSPPGLLNSTGSSDGSDYDMRPTVTADSAGNWIVAWAMDSALTGNEFDIAYARSTNGLAWSAAQLLNTDSGSDEHSDGPVVIVTDDNGVWIAAFTGNDYEADPGGYRMMVARSTTAGLIWSPPQVVSYIGSSYLPDFYTPSLATDRLGNWILVWSGDSDPEANFDQWTEVYYTKSNNDGMTWSYPQTLVTPESADPYGGSNPSIATDGMQNWTVVWGSDDHDGLAYVRSYNAGASWSTPTQLDAAGGVVPDGADGIPCLVADSAGHFTVLWYRQRSDYLVSDSDLLAATVTVGPPMPVSTTFAAPLIALSLVWIAYRRLRRA